MSWSQPVRTLVLALVFISVAVLVRSYLERDLTTQAPLEDDSGPPAIRRIRERQPTIVESNENWMQMEPEAGASGDSPPSLPPVPELPLAPVERIGAAGKSERIVR